MKRIFHPLKGGIALLLIIALMSAQVSLYTQKITVTPQKSTAINWLIPDAHAEMTAAAREGINKVIDKRVDDDAK